MLDAPWAKLFRRKAIGKLRFNECLSYAEDKLFVFGFLSECKSIYTCPHTVYHYYLRPGSLGSDRSSDRHVDQLNIFLPFYADLLGKICKRVPESRKAAGLYHRDLVGRYVCRALNILATRRTKWCMPIFVDFLYSLMKDDPALTVFSIRPGQVVNVMLFKIGNPSFTAGIYRATAWLVSLFKRK
jgi:hypothetical protein